jgi:transposase
VEAEVKGVESLTEEEVAVKAEWRRFTGEYKLKVLRKAEQCEQPGEIGGLLTREGLYCPI